MLSITNSASVQGIDASIIRIETDISNGLPGIELVGYLSSEVKEAKERVKIAIKNSGYDFINRKITVNLSPADIRKSGTRYDLAIAIGMLICEDVIKTIDYEHTLILGELKFNGEISKVNGVLCCCIEAIKNGFKKIIVPSDNYYEASVIKDIEIIPVNDLHECVEYLNIGLKPEVKTNAAKAKDKGEVLDFSDVKGQFMARRAAEITAAGMHNLLMAGPPGAGKTMIARRIPTIMPELTYEEQIELTRIYSVAGKLPDGKLLSERPFRDPHHSITKTALIGGGRLPTPGEISYANFGILFMDELPEFNRDNIEVLRQPIEEHRIVINRINNTVVYPADFTLVAALNRCPCGFYPDRRKCHCMPNQIKRYLSKISQPILDRIDLLVDIPAIKYDEMLAKTKPESSATIRQRVLRARKMQSDRYQSISAKYNSRLSSKEAEAFCQLSSSSKEIIKDYFYNKELSARSYYRILKTSRTIADLEGMENILDRHVNEALMFRMDSLEVK